MLTGAQFENPSKYSRQKDPQYAKTMEGEEEDDLSTMLVTEVPMAAADEIHHPGAFREGGDRGNREDDFTTNEPHASLLLYMLRMLIL